MAIFSTLHQLGEGADEARVLPDRVIGVVLVDEMLSELIQMIAEQLDGRYSHSFDRRLGMPVHRFPLLCDSTE